MPRWPPCSTLSTLAPALAIRPDAVVEGAVRATHARNIKHLDGEESEIDGPRRPWTHKIADHMGSSATLARPVRYDAAAQTPVVGPGKFERAGNMFGSMSAMRSLNLTGDMAATAATPREKREAHVAVCGGRGFGGLGSVGFRLGSPVILVERWYILTSTHTRGPVGVEQLGARSLDCWGCRAGT